MVAARSADFPDGLFAHLRCISTKISPRHVGESRQMQLVRDGDCLGRAVTVFGEDEISLSPTWIVAVERVRSVEKNHDVSILF
jgi:hypothetical protein